MQIKRIRKRIRKIISPLRRFLHSNQSSGLILLAAVVVSLIWANSSNSSHYFNLLNSEWGINISSFSLIKTTEHWINDGLMCFFFLMVGLEIKRELIIGELSEIKQASLPIIAALGGMIIPALFYIVINLNSDAKSGWAIPMATDIAFALAVLGLLGKRIPLSLKIFLAALAIVDDLGAILIIAIFYTETISFTYLLGAGVCVLFLIALNYFKFYKIVYYIPFGIILWFCIYKSGIHATIAGVLFAFTIPMEKEENSTLIRLENFLHTPVNYFIMPIFAMANTGIVLSPELFKQLLSPLGWGISAGLIVGKPLGISLFSYLAIKFKLAVLPLKVNKRQLLGVGVLAGIGFTMSVFIALLSFKDLEHQNIAKLSILLTSIVAGVLGSIILLYSTKKVISKSENGN